MGVLDEDWWRKLQLGEGWAPMADAEIEPMRGMLKQAVGALGSPSDIQTPASALMSPEFWERMSTTPKVKSTISGATLPGDIYSGKQPMGLPSKTEDLTRVGDMLGMMGTGAFGAKKGAAGIFGGKLSQTADQQALKEAMRMEKGAMTPSDIWHDTGWGRGMDNKWRYEIPDNLAATKSITPNTKILSQYIDHPELYKAYPISDLKATVGYYPRPSGYFDPNAMMSGTGTPFGIAGRSHDERLSTGLHEMQHAVQTLEGFASGSNPHKSPLSPNFKPLVKTKTDEFVQQGMHPEKAADRAIEEAAMEIYNRAAGEVEARNVEHRRNWDSKRRREVPPWYSQDVLPGDVLFDRGKIP